MKKYQTPCIDMTVISTEDIMQASTTLGHEASGIGAEVEWSCGLSAK